MAKSPRWCAYAHNRDDTNRLIFIYFLGAGATPPAAAIVFAAILASIAFLSASVQDLEIIWVVRDNRDGRV